MYYFNQTRQLMGRFVVPTLIILLTTFFSPHALLAAEAKNEGQKSDAPEISRTIVKYDAPDVEVVRQDGTKSTFSKELDDGRPVILDFVFISCSAICPMLSHVFSKVETKLAKEGQKVHLMSVSIDPESDTPESLREYAKKFKAGPDWSFYTSTREASIALQKAFNTYRGDKMNHIPVILMRAKPGKPWLRLDGFVSPDAVIKEYHDLLKEQ